MLRNVQISSLRFDLGSDHHFPPTGPGVDSYIDEIRRQQKASTLVLPGDLWSNYEGVDTIDKTNEVLDAAAKTYREVLFVIGNHDARGVPDVWLRLLEAPNLITPRGNDPLIVTVDGVRLMLANLFYDGSFIDIADFTFNEKDLEKYYKGSPDGKYLFDGDFRSFSTVAENVRSRFEPNIEALITHALPSPNIVRVSKSLMLPERVEAVGSTYNFINDSEVCVRLRNWVSDKQRAIWLWSLKTAFMGSNVLTRSVGFRDGLTAIYGHDHDSNDTRVQVAGRNVRFLSHQVPFRS